MIMSGTIWCGRQTKFQRELINRNKRNPSNLQDQGQLHLHIAYVLQSRTEIMLGRYHRISSLGLLRAYIDATKPVKIFVVLIKLYFSLPSWFFGFTCIPPPTQREHSWYCLACPTSYIFYLIWQEILLVLGKLLSTVKWSTFCVSFMSVLTILGWLWGVKIF